MKVRSGRDVLTLVRERLRSATAERAVAMLIEPRLVVRAVVKRSPSANFATKLEWDAVDRPHYVYGTYQAALQAKALGLGAICVIELGVAGGNGLVTLEQIANEVAREVGVEIEVFGFDAGDGMPSALDYRDLPYVWQPGMFTMDVDALRARLGRAQLILGDVGATIPAFVKTAHHAPIGFVAFDLDYYSSTAVALALLDSPHAQRLPRLFCYFDDIIGDDFELHSPHVGELLAIEEFNAQHDSIKVDKINALAHKRRIPAKWNEQIYVAHDFAHPLYNQHIHPSSWDLGLGTG